MRKAAFALVFLFTSSVFAQTAKVQTDAPRSPKTVSYKERTNYDFDTGDEVEGSIVNPDVEMVTSRLKTRSESLVKARGSFLPELLASVDWL